MKNLDSFFYQYSGQIVCNYEYNVDIITTGIFSFDGLSCIKTKTLVEFYIANGLEPLLQKLKGNFAVLIIDGRTKILHLITDPFASRPVYLYWNSQNKVFSCANSIKEITKKLCLSELNWDQQIYKKYLSQDANLDSTFAKGVSRLKGGICCSIDLKTGSLTTINYSEKNSTKVELDGPTTIAGFVEAYRAVVMKSVDDYVKGYDRAVVTLSGGFDSSIIYALAAQKIAVDAASICTVTSLHNQEVDRARELTTTYKSNHLIYPVGFSDKPNQADWIRMVISTESAHNNFESFLKSQLFTQAKAQFGESHLILSGLGSDQYNGGTTVLDYANTGFNASFSEFMQNMLRDKWTKYREKSFTHFFQFAYNFTALDFRETLWPFEDDLWTDYAARNGRSIQRNGVLLESKLAYTNQFDIGLPFLDQSTLDLLHAVPEQFQDDLFYDKQILRRAFKDLLPKSFDGKPKFHRTKNAEQKIFQYLSHIIYGNNYGLLKMTFDASPALRSKFSIDKLIVFLEEVKTSPFFPAYTHLLSIISMGLLDAYFFHGETFTSNTNSDYQFYAVNNKDFDRGYLEKRILTDKTEKWDIPAKREEHVNVYVAKDNSGYLLEWDKSEYLRIASSNTVTVFEALDGETSINAICETNGIERALIESELEQLCEKGILLILYR